MLSLYWTWIILALKCLNLWLLLVFNIKYLITRLQDLSYRNNESWFLFTNFGVCWWSGQIGCFFHFSTFRLRINIEKKTQNLDYVMHGWSLRKWTWQCWQGGLAFLKFIPSFLVLYMMISSTPISNTTKKD